MKPRLTPGRSPIILKVRNCLVRQNSTVAVSEPSFGGPCLSWSYHTGRTPGKEPPEQKNTSRHPEMRSLYHSLNGVFVLVLDRELIPILPQIQAVRPIFNLYGIVFPHGAECDSMETVHGVRMRDHRLLTTRFYFVSCAAVRCLVNRGSCRKQAAFFIFLIDLLHSDT